MAVNEAPGRGDDGEILSKTRQITNEQGHIKFEIELPSGRKVESEFFNPEFARKALLTWIATIKSEQESDKAAAVASAREKARELGILNRPKPKTDNPDEPLDSAPRQLPTPSLSSQLILPATLKPAASSTPAPASLDGPDAFAREGLAKARRDVEYWKGVSQNAMLEWQKAQTDAEKWEKILTAISGGVTIGQGDASPAGGIIVPTRVPKRGRPRKQVPVPVSVPADNPDTK